MTSNVLLLVPADREPQGAAGEAIAAAKERGGRLFAVVVVDPELVERVSATLSNFGFMGEKVSDEVGETLLREYRNRAEATGAAIVEQARAQGVEAEARYEEGDPGEICQRLIPPLGIGLAVLLAERRSWLARLLARDAVRIPALAGCQVRVIEDDR
jgi:nucleotide-binding universal stress UspA family protein